MVGRDLLSGIESCSLAFVVRFSLSLFPPDKVDGQTRSLRKAIDGTGDGG